MEGQPTTIDGKILFGIMFIVLVLIGTGFGFVVGTSTDIQHIKILNSTLFHPNPLGMALYGATTTTFGLLLISGIVKVLSRFDESQA